MAESPTATSNHNLMMFLISNPHSSNKTGHVYIYTLPFFSQAVLYLTLNDAMLAKLAQVVLPRCLYPADTHTHLLRC